MAGVGRVRGSYEHRGRTWRIRFDLPRGLDGARRQKRHSGYRTEGAARAALVLFTMPLGWRCGRVPYPPMPAGWLSEDEALALALARVLSDEAAQQWRSLRRAG